MSAASPSTDRELLEKAAKAAGITFADPSPIPDSDRLWLVDGLGYRNWNPLTDDGDALRLAVKLGAVIGTFPSLGYSSVSIPDLERNGETYAQESHADHANLASATRRAIVRAAAAIWESA